jgi:hypothetical protein
VLVDRHPHRAKGAHFWMYSATLGSRLGIHSITVRTSNSQIHPLAGSLPYENA